jgi:hypothetical protein
MAERFRQVHPDEILTLRDGREVAVVSEELFVNEVAKIASFIAFAGGTMSAVVYRQPTDLRGEMVTVGAVLSWADRTDARPQPEPASAPPQRLGEDELLAREIAELDAPLDELEEAREVGRDQASRDGGSGAGALPFQGEIDLSEKIEALEPDGHPRAVEMEPRQTIPRPAPVMTDEGLEPALPRPAHDDDVDDGLSGVGGEDLSEIPEHMR